MHIFISFLAVMILTGCGTISPEEKSGVGARSVTVSELQQWIQAVQEYKEDDADGKSVRREELGLARDAADSGTSSVIETDANILAVRDRSHQIRRVESALGRYNASTSQGVIMDLGFFEIEYERGNGLDKLLNFLMNSDSETIRFFIDVYTEARWVAQRDDRSAGGTVRKLSNNNYHSREILKLLDDFGDVKSVYIHTVETTNNRVASAENIRTEKYVRKASMTPASRDTVSEFEIDDLLIGLSVNYQPTVTESGIMLRMGLSHSVLVDRSEYRYSEIFGTNFVTEDYNTFSSFFLEDGKPRLYATRYDLPAQDSGTNLSIYGNLGFKNPKERKQRRKAIVRVITATLAD